MATGNLNWQGEKFRKDFEALMSRRIKAACVFLKNQIQADISQPGTLRYTPVTKKGKASKSQKTVYNFTHSRPGNPPYKQTGNYRRSFTYEVAGLVGRVGTNMPQGLALELGTSRMAPRPHIRANLVKHAGTIRAIVGGTIKPGELPETESNQSRSGHLGAGAREAGYD